MNITIIGNGPAAISALETIRGIDKSCEITIVSKEKEDAYSPCFLANYLSGEIEKDKLRLRGKRFYDEQMVETIFGNPVTEIIFKDRKVKLKSGRELCYDFLLIAAGSNPIIPELPNIAGNGIFSFKTISDIDNIMSSIKNVNAAVVMGSGFIGLEAACALKKRGINVTVIEKEDKVLPRMLDNEMAEIVRSHMEKNGVRIMTGAVIKSIQRKQGEVEGVQVDKESIPCGLLVVAAGVRPNLEMMRGDSIRTNYGVIVDDRMRTSCAGVYAVGDIAEMEIQGVRKINPIWFNAVKGGEIAGFNIMGIKRRYAVPLIDMNTVTLFGMPILSVGIQKGVSMVKRRRDGKGIRKVYLDENGRINGVQLIRDVARGGLYLSIIDRHISYIDKSARKTGMLFGGGIFNKGYPL